MKTITLFVLGFVLLLGACAPPLSSLDASKPEDQAMPVMQDDFLVARDGTHLPLRYWDGQDDKLHAPRAIIIALHGMSDYSNAFDMPAKVWARLGITTLAYDQRGFGRAVHPGVWVGSKLMRSDFYDAVTAAHQRYPGVPVFALGESMGGAVLLSALALKPELSQPGPVKLDGVIFVAPAVWSRSDMPISYRVALFLVAHLLPNIVLSNNAAGKIVTIIPSDNVPMLIALGHDPLFQKTTRAETLFGLVNLMDEAHDAAVNLKTTPPILFLYGANDQIIPAKATQEVVAALGERARVHRYEHGYHMLLRDLEGEMVDKDIANWIFEPPQQRIARSSNAPEEKDLAMQANSPGAKAGTASQ